MNRVFRFFSALLLLIPRKNWGTFLKTSEFAGFNNPFSISWSQGGEDLALLHAINGKSDGLFIDVGAHHPFRFSTTQYLYRLGWSGVNIDVNDELISVFKQHRKRDLNICAAVGTAESYTCTIFKEAALSTISNEWRKKFSESGWEINKTIKVPGVTLREIYETTYPNQCIDLLSIDAEGSDFDVLKSMYFETLSKVKYPRLLLLEASPRFT